MEALLYTKFLALILIYKYKITSKNVTTILREIDGVGSMIPIDHGTINTILEESPIDLPMLTEKDWYFGEALYYENYDNDINILEITEYGYPKYLKVIKDAPPLLFIKGNQNIFDDLPGVAIVGARKASNAGVEISRRLANYVVDKGWAVVSGLALGIDAAAHAGALENDGKTIAVLAGGLKKPNPVKNAKLGYEILEKNGAWVSEHSIEIPTLRHHFVPRNRIQIGLSAGSIIVEAALQSGSLSQARFCIGQNRPLFAVVPQEKSNPLKLNCEGTLHMIDDLGAVAIRSKDDYPKLVELLEKQREIIN